MYSSKPSVTVFTFLNTKNAIRLYHHNTVLLSAIYTESKDYTDNVFIMYLSFAILHIISVCLQVYDKGVTSL